MHSASAARNNGRHLAARPWRLGIRRMATMSLRTRLLVLVALATLVPAILVGLRFFQNRTSEIQAALVTLSATANNISNDLDEKIRGTAQLHYGLARARDLDTRDRAACSAFLSAVREKYPQYTGILTIDPDGMLFCEFVADRPHSRSQRSGLFPASAHRQGCRDAGAGLRPADRNVGAADRLSGAFGNRPAEIRPARFLQPAEVRGISSRTPAAGEWQICSWTMPAPFWFGLRAAAG